MGSLRVAVPGMASLCMIFAIQLEISGLVLQLGASKHVENGRSGESRKAKASATAGADASLLRLSVMARGADRNLGPHRLV